MRFVTTRATSGFVWHEWTDWQSVDCWENEGGSYNAGDIGLEQYFIVRDGFNRWFDHPWVRYFIWPNGIGGCIAGWCMQITLEAAYRAGLRDDSTWPKPTWWLGAEKSLRIQGLIHDAYMVGITDDQTRAKLMPKI